MELEIGITNSDTFLAEPWFSSDTSTGYLEDAIAGWGVWCKQQNSPSYSMSQDQKETHCLEDQVDLFPICFSTRTHRLLDDYSFADCEKFNARSQSSSQNDMQLQAAATQEDSPQRIWASRKSDANDASVSKGQRKKIAYPFEMVKRGGVEGETALEEINQQMRMSPAKPIPHPVGDCVALPCISARGFGISGKAVVALARIHTQGRGSITIVRTKG